MADENIATIDVDEDEGLPGDTGGTDDAGGSDGADEQVADKTPEEIKAIARTMGWTDKEKFRGDKTKFVDAIDYIKATHGRNTALNRQTKVLTNVIEELKRHHKLTYEAEVKRHKAEIDALIAQRKVAVEDGDVEKFEKIEKEIDATMTKAPVKPDDTPISNPDFEEWVADNAWYRDDPAMKKFADDIGDRLAGTMSYPEILVKVRKVAEIEFPEKFGKKAPEPKPGATVEASTRRTAPKKTYTKADLTDSQRVIMKQFVRSNVMTEQEYIDDLVKRGDIG